MKDNNPGDYYKRKGETARMLHETIWRLKQLQQYEPHLEKEYQRMIEFLEKRLEMACYVGD